MTQQSIEIKEIFEKLPHRYPFLLVDRILNYEKNSSITGLKNVTINEPFFQGHFPGEPVMPGVLILEAMAQTAGILSMLSVEKETPSLVYFMTIDKAKFRKPVVPGDTLHLKMSLLKKKRNIWSYKGMAYVEEKLVAEAELMAMITDA